MTTDTASTHITDDTQDTDKEDKARHLNLRNEPEIYRPTEINKLFMDIFLDTDWQTPSDADKNIHAMHTPLKRNATKSMKADLFENIAENSGTHHPKIHMSTNGIGSIILTTKGQNQQWHRSDYSQNGANGTYAKIVHRKILLIGHTEQISFYDAHVFGHPLLDAIRDSFTRVFGKKALNAFDTGLKNQQTQNTENYKDFWKKIEKDKNQLGNVPSFIIISPQGKDVKVLPLSAFALLADAQQCKTERINKWTEQKELAEKAKKEKESSNKQTNGSTISETEETIEHNETPVNTIGSWMATEHSNQSQNTSVLCNPQRQRLLVIPPPAASLSLRNLYKIARSKGSYFPIPYTESFNEAMTAYLISYERLLEHKLSEGKTYRNQNMKTGLENARHWLTDEINNFVEFVIAQGKELTNENFHAYAPSSLIPWLTYWKPNRQNFLSRSYSPNGFRHFLEGALISVSYTQPKSKNLGSQSMENSHD